MSSALPDELLLRILSESVAFHSVFNHSLFVGPDSTWARILRHKKSIVLVSKRWNRLATPLLYREVFLRRRTQLQPFMHTLSNSVLGRLVEELTLTEWCSVEPPIDRRIPRHLREEDVDIRNDRRDSQKSIIRMLPHLCNGLKRLVIYSQVTNEVLRYIISEPSLQRITTFVFGSGDGSGHNEIGPALFQSANRIRQLSIHMLHTDIFEPSSESDAAASLEFLVLEELRIDRWTEGLPIRWSMPKLKRLSLVGLAWDNTSVGLFHDVPTQELCTLLRKNGRNIEYLALLGSDGIKDAPLEAICSSCPKLQHLVLEQLPLVTPHLFPSVKHLDMYPGPRFQETMKRELADRVACFPSLESINFICDQSVLDALFSLFPIPPGLDVIQMVKEARLWLQPSTTLLEISTTLTNNDRRILIQTIESAVLDREADDEDDEDEDYSPPTTDSSSEDEDTYADEDREEFAHVVPSPQAPSGFGGFGSGTGPFVTWDSLQSGGGNLFGRSILVSGDS